MFGCRFRGGGLLRFCGLSWWCRGGYWCGAGLSVEDGGSLILLESGLRMRDGLFECMNRRDQVNCDVGSKGFDEMTRD